MYVDVRKEMEALLVRLREMKAEVQGDEARALAITITELEKAYAYFVVFFGS